MKLAIITVRRPEAEFIYPSLLSLLAVSGYAGEVDVFVGDDDPEYLRFLEACPRFRIHRPEEFAPYDGEASWSLQRKHSLHYTRALRYFEGQGDDLCLCEDDVLYAPGFVDKVAEAVGEMMTFTRDAVLSLYCDRDFGSIPVYRISRLIAAYPAYDFYGTQAVYFPASLLAEHADWIEARAVLVDGKPTDRVMSDLYLERQNIYQLAHSLVQHIGRVSTGLGPFHCSPTFDRPWPGPESEPV